MIEILSNLFQGDREDAIRCSQSGKVDVIVYLGQEMNEPKLTHRSKVPIIHFPLNDGKNPHTKYEALYGILYAVSCRVFLSPTRDAPKLLVACRHGMFRSPAVVLSFLVKNNHYSFAEAKRLLEEKGVNFSLLPGTRPVEVLNSIKKYLEEPELDVH